MRGKLMQFIGSGAAQAAADPLLMQQTVSTMSNLVSGECTSATLDTATDALSTMVGGLAVNGATMAPGTAEAVSNSINSMLLVCGL